MSAQPERPHVALIVEGRGDFGAVPVLLRRHLEAQERFEDILGKPIVANDRGALTKPNGIEGFVAAATARPGCRAVLVVADSDKDASCELGPSLRDRASKNRVPVEIALAEAAFEDWLHASAESLGLAPDFVYQPGRGGHHAIKEAMRPEKYVKPVWQPKLAHRMDLPLARKRCPSLNRMLTKFDQLAKLVDQA